MFKDIIPQGYIYYEFVFSKKRYLLILFFFVLVILFIYYEILHNSPETFVEGIGKKYVNRVLNGAKAGATGIAIKAVTANKKIQRSEVGNFFNNLGDTFDKITRW
jgi:hypothetical protein